MTVKFEILHNISISKGWGRFAAKSANKQVIQSSTGNEWVSAPKTADLEEGQEVVVTLQTMQRTKSRRETINTTNYRIVVRDGAVAELGFWNGLHVAVEGAALVSA